MQALFKLYTTSTMPTWRAEAPATADSKSRDQTDYARLLMGILLALGVGIRLFHFFNNRSFFIDELYLNVNTIKMGFWALATQPFDYEQKAPIGYLWMTRLCVLLFGKQEMSLRLFPLLCGLGTLFVFASVAQHFLKKWGALAAVGILALSSPCIYHSVEAKQYSTELFVAALALWWYVRYHKDMSTAALLTWGVLGAVALWFSFSAIFVFASIAIAMSAHWVLTAQWKKFFRYLIPFTLWLISFGVQYVLFIGKYPQSGWLIDFFDKIYDGFMPLPPSSLADVKWYFQKPYTLLVHPLGLLLNLDGGLEEWKANSWRYLFKMGWLPVGLILGGMAVMFRQKRTLFFCLLLPILFALLASGLRLYPFHNRFVLFLVPVLLLFIGFGIDALRELFTRQKLLFYVLVGLLFLPLCINTGRQLANPDLFVNRENNREPLLYINEHYRPGDAVYIFWNMSHAYEYYKDAYKLKFNAVQGSNPKAISNSPEEFLRNLQPELQQFKGKKRVWFVFDYLNRNAIGEYVHLPVWYHTNYFSPTTEVQNIFSQMGRQVDELYEKPYNTYPHTVVLYELNK
ncbi:ArnT family glycosyltransferase [Hymenobacter tenuis]